MACYVREFLLCHVHKICDVKIQNAEKDNVNDNNNERQILFYFISFFLIIIIFFSSLFSFSFLFFFHMHSMYLRYKLNTLMWVIKKRIQFKRDIEQEETYKKRREIWISASTLRNVLSSFLSFFLYLFLFLTRFSHRF